MPARVHAFLVVRPDGRATTNDHLRRTLAALAAQSRPVDVLTIVVCGGGEQIRATLADSGAEGVISTGRGTSYAEALRMASRRLDGDTVWVLAQDTAPEPEALAQLLAVIETSPSVAIAAPKVVSWDDRDEIVSLGRTLTRYGRAVGLADGEHDQGQHDSTEDVLGADVRGLLVRADAWRALGGIDPGLRGADEGLDLGVRARLAGGRVVVAPGARVAVAGDGTAGLPRRRRRFRVSYATRNAQLHRRLVYAAPVVVVLHWLSLLPLALWRSAGHLVAKNPGRIAPEFAATVAALVRIPGVARARRRIRATRTVTWAQLAPLRIDARTLRRRLDDDAGASGAARSDLRFFSTSGGAWIVLSALVVSLAAFPALLAWPVLGGGALAPLRATVAQLWADALAGARPLGWDTVGPADPFSTVIAVVGSLWPADPSRVLVVLWVLALPLAACGAWFAATRLSEKAMPRAFVAIAWTLAPPLVSALVEGRPTGVLVHLLLPWLVYSAVVAHRSWTHAAVASLLAAVIVACSPSLAVPLVALWILALVIVAVRHRGRGAARVVWLVVPAAALSVPLVWQRWRSGDLWSLLADPGVVATSAPHGTDLAGRWALFSGFPTGDLGGWMTLTNDASWTMWVPVLVAPLVLLALCAPVIARLLPAAVSLVVALAGAATAAVTSGVALSATGAVSVGIWPGAAQSLLWGGVVAAAALTLDALRPRSVVRGIGFAVATLALVITAVPGLTAVHRDASVLTNGPASTLPAYVAAEGADRSDLATLVLRAQPRGGLAAQVVWGDSESLGGQTTLQSARLSVTAGDRETASATADLATGAAGDVIARLAHQGIGFILVGTPSAGETDAARAERLETTAALNARDDLEAVGETSSGDLWIVPGEITPRVPSADERELAWAVSLLQIVVIVAAILLAVPTATTLRRARHEPRTVGGERT